MNKVLYPLISLSLITGCSAIQPSIPANTTQLSPNSVKIIAHRGGKEDAPENTIYAIQQALNNGADEVWITAQLSKDNKIVLYRPKDLSTHTNASGPVSKYTFDQLSKLDAGSKFNPKDNFPFKNKNITIPSLEEVLYRFPATHFYIDIKSADADPNVFSDVLVKTIEKNNAKNRVRIYSTESKFLQALPTDIATFATRDYTRHLLVDSLMSDTCSKDLPDHVMWHGFELSRQVKVVETFTLGEGVSETQMLWQPRSFKCLNQKATQKIILFGIKTADQFDKAKKLPIYGVMVDSPKSFKNINKPQSYSSGLQN